MSYHHRYASGELEEQDSPAYQTSSNLETAKSKEQQEANRKLGSSDGARSCNDQFVPNDQSTSNPRKHCDSVAKNLTIVHQSASLALAENSAIARTKVCTESNHIMKSWKTRDELEKAREVHHRKFQATLDSLVEEFESGAFASRIQNIKTLKVRFRVHYVTHCLRQTLAVTGNHHNLGAWKSFVPMKTEKHGFWVCTIIFPISIQVEWKFILVEDGEIVRWEECENRQLEVSRNGEDKEIQLYCTWGYQ